MGLALLCLLLASPITSSEFRLDWRWDYDGWRILGAAGKEARVWDASDGRRLQVLAGHGDQVSTVALLLGDRALTGAGSERSTLHPRAEETSVRLWNLATGKVLQRFEGLAHPAGGFSLSADGTRLLAVSEPKAQVWDVATGERKLDFDGVDSGVRPPWMLDAAFGPDGRWILAIGTFEVRILDAETSQPVACLMDPERRVQFATAAFSPSGTRVVTVQTEPRASHMGTLWDARSGACLRKFGRLNGWPQEALFASERRVLTLDASALRVWNAETGSEIASHEIPGGGAISFALDPMRRYALVRVRYVGGFVWDLQESRVTATADEIPHSYSGLVGFAADGRTFLVRESSGYPEAQEVTVRESATGKVVRRFRLEGSGNLG